MAVAPDHPLAQAAAADNPALAAFIEECKRTGTAQEAHRQGREEGLRHRHPRRASVRPDLDAAGLRRQFHPDGIRHGRDLRLPRARPARPRLRQRIRPRQHARRLPARRRTRRPSSITDVAYDGDGRMINSRFLDGMTIAGGQGGGRPPAGERDSRQPAGGRAQGQFPPARLGHLAPALLGLPDPGHPLRGLRRRAGARRGPAGEAAGRRHLRRARQSARPASDLEARRLPAMRQAGAARDRHDGHLRRFVLVLRPLHRPLDDDGADRPRAPSTAGCRSTSISAASSTRSCTCSIRASSPAR